MWDKDWTELRRLLELGDLRAFWLAFAQYLECMNIVSPARQTIHRAALLTAEALPSECQTCKRCEKVADGLYGYCQECGG